MAKTKPFNLFPTLRGGRGGYTCGIRFMDEARGERWFDAEWSVCYGGCEPGRLILGVLMSCGDRFTDQLACDSIGRDLRVGDHVVVWPVRWNMRGRHNLPGCTVRIVSVKQTDDSGLEVHYEKAVA